MKKLIAHRALDNHKYRENSIKGALECLKKDYITGIELDIRITKDNKIVLYHNLLYNLVSINHLKYKQLKNVDLLDKLLRNIKSDKIILLDIKSETNNYKKLVRELLKIIKKYPLNYYLCSFNYSLIMYLRKKTNYPVGLFITDLINKNKSYEHLSFLAISKSSYFTISFPIKMVWTINHKQDIKKYDYVITDCPYLLL